MSSVLPRGASGVIRLIIWEGSDEHRDLCVTFSPEAKQIIQHPVTMCSRDGLSVQNLRDAAGAAHTDRFLHAMWRNRCFILMVTLLLMFVSEALQSRCFPADSSVKTKRSCGGCGLLRNQDDEGKAGATFTDVRLDSSWTRGRAFLFSCSTAFKTKRVQTGTRRGWREKQPCCFVLLAPDPPEAAAPEPRPSRAERLKAPVSVSASVDKQCQYRDAGRSGPWTNHRVQFWQTQEANLELI